MARALLLLAHADAHIRPRYEAALGSDVRVVPFLAPALPGVKSGGLSSRYDHLAARLRRDGMLLPGLLTYLGIEHWEYESLIVAGYSSAYALTRALCVSPADREAIAGWILIDGGHAGLDPDGTASDAGIAWLAGLCRDAAEGRTVLAYGYTDVEPHAYASTRKTIQEALRLAGVTIAERQVPCAGCRLGFMMVRAFRGLLVEAHDHRIDAVQKQEHTAALNEWGAEFAARAVALISGQPAAPSIPSPAPISTTSTATLGELALLVAQKKLEEGVGEEPIGSNAGPAIRAFLSGCVRDGRIVGMSRGPWCAGFVGFCDAMARGALRLEGRDVEAPCHWRAAVWELVEDAKACAAWRAAGEYSPLPGDLAVFTRDGHDPRMPGQEGHVGRVETPPDAEGAFRCIEGNHEHRVARVEHRLGETGLVGFIAYPRPLVHPTYYVEASELAAGAAALGMDATARSHRGTIS